MGHTEPVEGKVQTTGDFTEMKEVDVEAPRAVDSGVGDAPMTAVPLRTNCRKKCLIAAAVLLVLLLLVGLVIGHAASDDDDDDMDRRNKMCAKLGHRRGGGGRRGGRKGGKDGKDGKDGMVGEEEEHDREGEAQGKRGKGRKGRKDDDDDDDKDAAKYCMTGGKVCGSSLMLTNKETQEEEKMTVYADEGGVLEVAEALKAKYDVSEPTPLSCAKPMEGHKGGKKGKGRH